MSRFLSKSYKNFSVSINSFVKIYIVFMIFVLPLITNETITAQNQLKIDKGWVMKTGDNAEWAKSEFDDSAWGSIQVGVAWEKAGYANYDGYAWYRNRIEIPKKWNQNTKHDFLSLSLGFIDDVDVTYFNGEKIASTGILPPDYSTAYFTHRMYRIPKALIHWDEMNTIAIKVYDGDGDGGFYEGPYIIKEPGIEEIFDLNFKLEDSDGIYHSPDSLSIILNIQNYSNEEYQIDLSCNLKSDHVIKDIVHNSKKSILNIMGKDEIAKSIDFIPPKPGFYRILVNLSTENGEMVSKSITLGYDPEKIKTERTRENNFEEFWKKRKQELSQVEPEFKMTRSDRSTDSVEVYLVEMKSYGNVRIKGWYTVPRKKGPYAAILSLPGYTSTMWPYTNRTNVATFALNPRGHGNSKDDVDPKGSEFMFLDFDPEHPKAYIYTGVYMDCIRAVDFLFSRPEIDRSRIGVEGASQGGGLSFATAALDQRVKFCAPDIPWLGDWVGYLEAALWPNENYEELIKIHDGLKNRDINRILSYFDTMNLAKWIRCPVFMSLGLQDDVCPPRNLFATYNQINSNKIYRVYPFSGHGLGQKHYDLKNEWMAKILGMEETGL
jgi:cephalosporin-C deacetylase-like acetyl esterase